ncbi:MAG: glycosyltransferase [Candidatus Kapabacteria bacterium]|nr:glycosyltransferase [Ignavibacteriota bacterium]MCW5884663.1 glycosyltransferase [Candidatus Kapabacteria bacterium]
MSGLKFDVCIVCLNYISNDARSLNLAISLVNMGKKVAVLCLKDNLSYKYCFELLTVDIEKGERLLKKMYIFYSAGKNFKIISDYYVAAELYSLPLASYLAGRSSAKLIYDSREIFSAIGNTFDQPLKQKFFTYLEKYYIHKVDSVIVSGKLDAEYLKGLFPKKIRFHLIMNVPEYQPPVKSNLLRQEFLIDDTTRILIYQGMIMKGRGIEPAIRAIEGLEQCALVIMGQGDEMKNYFEKLVLELNLQNKVFFKSFVPYKELHKWTSSADIGLALFEPISLSYKLALPNKLFEYCMAGLPSISTNLPAISDVSIKYNFTKLIDYPINISKLQQNIIEISLPANYQIMSGSALEASKKFNYQNQLPVIKEIFNKL